MKVPRTALLFLPLSTVTVLLYLGDLVNFFLFLFEISSLVIERESM